jgi:hypothetical protein
MAEKSPRGKVLTVETRSVVLNIRIKPSLKAAMEKLAAKDHRTLSNWIELLLEQHLTRGKAGGKELT